MEQLITKVYEVFVANQQIFIHADLQPIRTIDKFRGQTTQPEKFEIYETPAIFIGWQIKWRTEGKTYVGDATIDFHIVNDEPSDTASIYTNYDEALKETFFYKSVQKVLDNLEAEGISKLQRLSETPVDTGVVCYNILSYQTTMYESVSNSILVNDIEVEINKGKLKPPNI
jgi:hypothetical protein